MCRQKPEPGKSVVSFEKLLANFVAESGIIFSRKAKMKLFFSNFKNP